MEISEDAERNPYAGYNPCGYPGPDYHVQCERCEATISILQVPKKMVNSIIADVSVRFDNYEMNNQSSQDIVGDESECILITLKVN